MVKEPTIHFRDFGMLKRYEINYPICKVVNTILDDKGYTMLTTSRLKEVTCKACLNHIQKLIETT